jgi:hypothetical protein|tara:strand:- start:1475 stop:1705 length:231 start_codon:yes stop_codon:yes gene_type:complete
MRRARRDATRATRARPSRRHGVARGAAVMDVDGEVDALVDAVRRLGDVDAGGTCKARATTNGATRARETTLCVARD